MGWYDRYVNIEQEVYKPKLQISVGRLENSMTDKKPSEKINIKNDKASHVTVKEHKKTGEIKNEDNIKAMPEKPKPKEINPQKEERKSTYAEVVKTSKVINEDKSAEKLKENDKKIYVEL